MRGQRSGDEVGSANGASGVVFCSARFYSVNSDWYFSVRECEDKGPYRSKADAEQAFGDFVSLLNRADFVCQSRIKH
ncbi:MAG: hypothetical protein COB04_08705 [Gammaproteobacteria bacterium]|nr:MAG: hypothetical protein COB04_08705 [Gammaproteobacteria bacterium]